jgi:UDP-N-acetylglucosamine--N-acetylmuramyl-(pentapeptide) pyrophosphoryl-undecaprenol N-acetylglucosamine transferase
MRLLLCCSELGLGHVSRIIPLGKRLEKRGHELFFFSGGKAYEILQKEFPHVYKCTPVAWYENASGIITSASLLNLVVPLPLFSMEKHRFELKSSSTMEIIRRYYDLREKLREIAPDLLISDGDVNALRLAEKWRIPSLYIANMIRPSYGFSTFLRPGERLVERYVKNCTRIVVPDNPPPYTVSEYNIGNIDAMGLKEKIEFIGSFVDTTPVEGAEEHIFVPISGPAGTRGKMIKTLLPVLEKLKTKCVISLGTPGKKASAKIGNYELHTWLSHEERAEAMRNAKFVIFSGGHATCFETIKHGKPSVCIPTQPEQLANAAKLQDIKCSLIAKNSKQLFSAVEKMDENLDYYNRNMKALTEFSSKYKGLDRATEIVETMLN